MGDLPKRLYLSPPDVGSEELDLVREAFDSNWIAPVGPHLDAFEAEFADAVGVEHALALSSGTAALHLGLIELGVGPGDEVLVSTLTFAASAFPIRYLGARPVFVDSEAASWNIDPAHVAEALADRARSGRPIPRCVVVVHLYGQTADMNGTLEACEPFGVPIIEDAAEALGATHGDRSAGALGKAGMFSFNGNKVITTSGGGMLVSSDAKLIAHARKLSAQAREPAPHYEHLELGYNYRLSNVLAAIGRGQLRTLERRVSRRREIFEHYRSGLGDLPGITFMPEAPWGRHARWLTCFTVDPDDFGTTANAIRERLEKENIEAKPLWKPMHLQPVFTGCNMIGGGVAERLFEQGLCVPSGSAMTDADVERVIEVVRASRPK